MKAFPKRILCLGLALLAAGPANALGLGEAIGNAVIGEPLRIEIPLLGGGSDTPSPACFRVVPPVTDIGADFVLRNARVDVVGERGGSKLVVTTPMPVHEPLVAFAVTAGCGFGLTRDYVLLSSMTAAAPITAPVAAAPVAPAAQAPAVASAAAAPVAAVAAPAAQRPATVASVSAPGDETLRLEADATLTALARKKYPLQPKAREKFVRMMVQANPALADGDAPIAAGTVLQVPPGLPLRRESSAAPRPAPAQAGQATPAAAAPQAKPNANPRKDRLMLSAGPDTSEAKLLDEAERLTAMMLEQAKAEAELIETIARLETSYTALRKDFARMENQLNAVEAERKAEKAAAANSISLDLVTLALAVLGGGAMGGMGLHVYQRRRPKESAKPEAPWWTAAEKAVPPAPRPKLASVGQPPGGRASAAQAPAESSQDGVLDFHTQPQDKP